MKISQSESEKLISYCKNRLPTCVHAYVRNRIHIALFCVLAALSCDVLATTGAEKDGVHELIVHNDVIRVRDRDVTGYRTTPD